jgi:predicted RNase H-like HicB family nuclease
MLATDLSKRIRFAEFDAFMKGVGFRIKVIRGSHVDYYHAPSDSLLKIRLHKSNEFVPDYWIASARGQLDGPGILDAQDFEGRLGIRSPLAGRSTFAQFAILDSQGRQFGVWEWSFIIRQVTRLCSCVAIGNATECPTISWLLHAANSTPTASSRQTILMSGSTRLPREMARLPASRKATKKEPCIPQRSVICYPEQIEQRDHQMRVKKYTVSDGKTVILLEPAEEGGYIVTSPFDPELVTQAESVEEAFEMAADLAKLLKSSRAKLRKMTERRSLSKVGS